MRIWASLLLCFGLGACASAPPLPPPQPLFHDELFTAPSQRISADDVFALSDSMRRYLHTEIDAELRARGRQRGLVAALYKRTELQLTYDTTMTRNAAEAFEARSGNCLSLVIMTAAFARELGLQVNFQSAYTDETWSRSGGMFFKSGHVNVTLGRRLIDSGTTVDPAQVTVDFLPGEEIRGLRTHAISDQTVIAMYMNNRAAEALAQGQLNDAYWWARMAMIQSPAFVSSYNTLGVIYLRHGDLREADQVFRAVLDRDPENTPALSNHAQVLKQQGRMADADAALRKLAQIEPYPPFHFFNLGVAAMAKSDYAAARDLFAREVGRAGQYHEFHFWLAVANLKLGDIAEARKHLALAMENSTTLRDRDLYSAKLEWLRSHGYH